MAKGMEAIYTQTITSGTAATITFNNIPQTNTDLCLRVSARGTQSGGGTQDISVWFNNDQSALYSSTGLTGTSNSIGSYRITNDTRISFALFGSGADATASAFGNSELYIPSYTTGLFKQITAEAVNGNNSSTNYWMRLLTHLYRSSAPITTLHIAAQTGTLSAGSTFTLYGISR